MKNVNALNWFLVNDDPITWIREIESKKGGVFEMVQVFYNPQIEKWAVKQASVDIYDFIDEAIIDDEDYEHAIFVLESYGYRATDVFLDEYGTNWEYLQILLQELKETYGGRWKQILAECFMDDFNMGEYKLYDKEKIAINDARRIMGMD